MLETSLIKVEEKDIDVFVQYAWEVYQNPETRFYPIVDSQSDLKSMYTKAWEDDYLWVIESDGHYGILPLLVDEEEKFVQANGGISTKGDFIEFAKIFQTLLLEEFSGYRLFCCYPSSHLRAQEFYLNNGYSLGEILLWYENDMLSLNIKDNSNFLLLNENNFEKFKIFHGENHPNVYWSADLIYKHHQKWDVVILGDDEIEGIAAAIRYDKENILYAEIYFLSGKHQATICNALLTQLRKKKVQRVVYFVDKRDDRLIDVVEEIGFKFVDDYCEYMMDIVKTS